MLNNKNSTGESKDQKVSATPTISLPKGGGAIRGIGEKFAANPVTGTGSMTVPIATSPGRSGFGPQLTLSYDSGSGNGPFGFGWSLSLPSITRKTDKGLPQYRDAEESDVFILSGSEDLVPVLVKTAKGWEPEIVSQRKVNGKFYNIKRYRPRIEGLYARIERWSNQTDPIDIFWRSISKDNITTWYGKTHDSRIADPTDKSHIFSWLICESYDDKGNAILYEYKSEDDKNVDRSLPQEQNRLVCNQFSQRYLKNIKYGNGKPNRDNKWNSTDPAQISDWSFEVIFDYGEHDLATPTTDEAQSWPVRQDPFSIYRAAFETRTYRLCQRVLMFHHFPKELGTVDCLVRSTDFDYTISPVASFITAVTQSGYVYQPDGTYLKKSLPKLEFGYTETRVDETVYEIDRESIENLPYGIDGSHYQWVDLDSEGLSGVLTEQADAWFYKRNRGNGNFGPLERVATLPSVATLSSGRQQLMDLAGDGLLDLVQFDTPLSGFYERTPENGWIDFRPFESIPNVAWKDPNLRFVDLTGDGHADILISEDTVFTWYPSRAEQGFGPAERTMQAWDEEKGPKLIFADATQSVYLADMSGDGLTDLVRIRNGDGGICYWPNMGYGRFGAKVTMSNAPVFDYSGNFDPKRIRLADIDGSGNTDIIYLAQDEVRLYFNQSGNSWSAPRRLTYFPIIDDLKYVTALDLLGNGTACLVWSSPLSGDVRQPMRYIDLMGGQKPHLLVYINNNMGAETEVCYSASTKFYLQDRTEGHPWVTRLPFPVHVIERTESRDLVSYTKLVSTFRYRHGYFDGVEREFRGFAHVEQSDAETIVGQFDLPPVVTKTWFHIGAYLKGDQLEAYFKNPENNEYFTGDNQAIFLPDMELPPNLPSDETREACRALKGSILRQEIYADDGSDKAQLPYSVSERSYHLQLLQPRGPNQHAVFFSHASETIDYHYERSFILDPADPEPDLKNKRKILDPRISHALTLEVDEFGNVTKYAVIGYGRRRDDPDLKPEEQVKQRQTLVTYTEAAFINKPNETDWYRIGVPVETQTFELTGVKPTATVFTIEELSTAAQGAAEIPYEKASDDSLQKRPIESVWTLYRKNDLSGLLSTGQVESMALPGESYKLAFTLGLLDIFQSKASRSNLTELLTGSEGRYRDMDHNGSLWIPSGLIFYSPTSGDAPPQELAFAREHFFLPHRFQDPFGNTTVVTYDDKYKLLIESTCDAVDNMMKADNDYRVLQPRLITDPNGNRSEVSFDVLGMVVGTAVMGKAAGIVEGDSFDTFTVNLTAQEIKDFFDAPNPRSLAIDHLGTATTRIIYDLERVPVCAASIARETHVSDLAQGEATQVQLSFVYSDGFGREAQTKIQAEPGPLDPGDPDSSNLDPRWVGTGAKIYNNKGKPVKQYEPFFSPAHTFGIEQHGVSSTLFYDPIERVVATLHPNNTYEKVIFDPWKQITYDVNDTVTFNPQADPDVNQFFGELPEEEYLPTWYQQRVNGTLGMEEKSAAEKTSNHADTPTIAHLDTLGRTFLTIADTGKDANGKPQLYRTHIELDIEGNQRAVQDALDRIVMKYDYDMLGTRIHQASMEAGKRWTLNNVAGKQIRAWDSRDQILHTAYDTLLRPTQLFVTIGSDPEILAEKTVYGEEQGDAKNHRGRIYQHFDSVGIVTNVEFDFKGNLRCSTRKLVQDYKTIPDWSSNPMPGLEAELFTSSTRYDALNRPIQLVMPHSDQPNTKVNVIQPDYNEANFLERVDAWLGEVTEPNILLDPKLANLHPVIDIDYNAKGQRTRIEYSNDVQTEYTYDKKTFRLTRLRTKRAAETGLCGLMDRLMHPSAPLGGTVFQDLSYVYDPIGNITYIRDDAQQTIFFKGQVVPPHCDYTYDAVYRLTEATGREHIGQVGQPETTWNDEFCVKLPHPGNGQAMRNYTEQYVYDAVGNLEKLIHQAVNGNWTRGYNYNEESQIESGRKSNRLSCTTVGETTESYAYDAHGNMTSMPHLTLMKWDFKDQLSATSRQVVNSTPPPDKVPETTFYSYDAGGQRVRKVTERQNGTRKEERIYLGVFEIYRKFKGNGNDIELERETWHVMDDKKRIALVETRPKGNKPGVPQKLIRYQFGNHLGSASLELDDKTNIISYEEYYPYGSTSYQAVQSQTETPKRYRYTGKEREEESELYYHGARYYVPWLGRWTAADPIGIRNELSLYVYAQNSPLRFIDDSGLQIADPQSDIASPEINMDYLGWNTKQSSLYPRLQPRQNLFTKTLLDLKLPEDLKSTPPWLQFNTPAPQASPGLFERFKKSILGKVVGKVILLNPPKPSDTFERTTEMLDYKKGQIDQNTLGPKVTMIPPVPITPLSKGVEKLLGTGEGFSANPRTGRAVARAAMTVWHAVAQAAMTVGHAVAQAAMTVGHAVARVAVAVGHAVAQTVVAVGHAVAQAAMTVGHAIARVAVAVGHAVAQTVVAVGHAVAQAASAIRHWFTRKCN